MYNGGSPIDPEHMRSNKAFISDLNECDSTPELCGENSVCNNIDGSYTCSCVEGYFQMGDICAGIVYMQHFPFIMTIIVLHSHL